MAKSVHEGFGTKSNYVYPFKWKRNCVSQKGKPFKWNANVNAIILAFLSTTYFTVCLYSVHVKAKSEITILYIPFSNFSFLNRSIAELFQMVHNFFFKIFSSLFYRSQISKYYVCAKLWYSIFLSHASATKNLRSTTQYISYACIQMKKDTRWKKAGMWIMNIEHTCIDM